MINLLGIGLDSKMLEKDPVRGDVWQRQSRYAEGLKHLFLLIYSPKKRAAYRKFYGDRKVTVIPTDSLNRGTFIIGALIKGWQICKKNNIDVLTAQDPFTTGCVGVILKWMFNLPLNVQIHTDFFDNKYWIDQRFINRVFNVIGKFVIKRADSIRIGTQYEKQRLMSIGIAEDKIHVIPVNAAVERFTSKVTAIDKKEVLKSLGLGHFKSLIISTGRFEAVKDFPALVRAMAIVSEKHPGVGLCILGDGTEREKIKAEVQRLKLDSVVVLPGTVTHDEVAKYLSVSDIFVMASIFEGTCIALAEACLSGMPVVATAFAGAYDLIVDGKTGYRVGIKDTGALSDRIMLLLDNPEKAKTMGLAGREYVLEMFNEEHNIRGVVKMWQETGRAFSGSK